MTGVFFLMKFEKLLKTKTMKTNLTIFLLLTFSLLFAQNDPLKGNYYFIPFSNEITAKKIGKEITKINLNSINKGNEYIVQIIDDNDDEVIYNYMKFMDKDLEKDINNKVDSIYIDKEKISYSISKKDFIKLTNKYYDRYEWSAGFYTAPVKLRFKDFEFEPTLSMGANLGLKIRINRKRENGFIIQPLVGFGITSVTLDNTNSNKEEASNLTAFTPNIGCLLNINENINFGLFLGKDILADKDKRQFSWKYNKDTWLGFGINISFSKEKENTAESAKN